MTRRYDTTGVRRQRAERTAAAPCHYVSSTRAAEWERDHEERIAAHQRRVTADLARLEGKEED